jgi:chemotaxis protein CheC
MRQLDELEIDALKEILNIGIGHAAESFSRTICSPVRLSVPSLEIHYGEMATKGILSLGVNIGSMIKQRFYGGFAADAILVFPNDATLELVRLMVGTDVPIGELHELEQDALVEIGNILFNSSVSVISDMIGIPFQSSMPRYESGNMDHLLAEFHAEDECLLLMNIAFLVEQIQIQGYIMFLMKVDSVEVFIASIKKYLGLPA